MINRISNVQRRGYAREIAEMHNWNYTTCVRAHYNMKPYIADRKIMNLLEDGIVQHIFYTIENDRDDSDIYTNAKRVNHLHLLMQIPNSIDMDGDFRKDMAKSLGINKSAVAGIEPVRGVRNISQYITKDMGLQGSHHNYYSISTIN